MLIFLIDLQMLYFNVVVRLQKPHKWVLGAHFVNAPVASDKPVLTPLENRRAYFLAQLCGA
jgi:hypothetical protein